MSALRLVRDDDADAPAAPERKKMTPGTLYVLDSIVAQGMATYSYVLTSGKTVSVTLPSTLPAQAITDAVLEMCEAVDAECRAEMELVR